MNLSLFPSKFDSESRLREQKNIESVRNEKQNQKYNINTKRSEKTTLAELQSEVLVCKIKFLGADLG